MDGLGKLIFNGLEAISFHNYFVLIIRFPFTKLLPCADLSFVKDRSFSFVDGCTVAGSITPIL